MLKSLETALDWCDVYKAEDRYFKDLDLERSPARILKMWKRELLGSYQPGAMEDLKRRFTTFTLSNTSPREMITQEDIQFYSNCAHHFVPFFGSVAFGYIPDKLIVGLSKIARVVDFYAHQLQVQERFTSQVADFLHMNLEARATIVVVRARHLCMEMRGVCKPGTITTTSAIRGLAVTDPSVKDEFHRLIGIR